MFFDKNANEAPDNGGQQGSLPGDVLALQQQIVTGLALLSQRVEAESAARYMEQLSAIYPKSRTVVFVGNARFAGNVKYAFLDYCRKARLDDATCAFLPSSQEQYLEVKASGLPCLPYDISDYSAQDLRTVLSAKVAVLDNHFVAPNWRHRAPCALLSGAKTIQLWHGIPIKKIGFEIIGDQKISGPGVAELFASCGPFDVFVAPNQASQREWERRFAFHDFAATGYPRNDVLFREPSAEDLVNVDRAAFEEIKNFYTEGRRVVLYAPTFRDYERGLWLKKAEIEKFAAFCRARDYVFYAALHPAEQGSIEGIIPQVNFVLPHTDLYPLVKYTNMLVSDYSSIVFDYLLLDRPIVFYRPDHETFVARSRSLISNHENYLCGPVAHHVDELSKAVETAFAKDTYAASRKALVKKLFDHCDGHSADRLSDRISALLNGSDL